MDVAFRPPDGSYLLNPPIELLRDLILSKGEEYWQRGGGGGQIIAGESPLFDEDGIQVRQAKRLGLSLKEPYGFILTFASEPTDELFVSITSPDYSQTTTVFVGDKWTVPIAFLVSRNDTWNAVTEFVRTEKQPTTITWGKLSDQKW